MTVNMNGGGVLLKVVRRWECRAPRCDQTAITINAEPHVRFHVCRGRKGTAGMTVPMTLVGSDVKVEAREREDYVAGELVQRNADGRPVMSVITTRADGSNDTTAYAPCATARSEEIR